MLIIQNPIEQLIQEHQEILRGVKLLEHTGKMVEDESIPKEAIDMLVKFFREYADQGHHAKEEDILFVKLKIKDPDIDIETSPISVLKEHHILGRKFVGQISNIDDQYPFVVNDYSDMLRRHIDIEDNLFPSLIEDNFDDKEIRAMGMEFMLADNKRDLPGLLALLDKIEINL